MNQFHTTRRRFLGAAGVVASSAFKPFSVGQAATGVRPANLLVIFHPNGLEPGWVPTGDATNFKLSPVLSALEPWRKKLVILNGIQGGIRNEVQGHAQGMTSLWTGSQIAADSDFAGHPSFDQIAAQRLGTGMPFRSIEFGVQSQPNGKLDNANVMIYGSNKMPIPAEDDPNRMFNRLFGSALADPKEIEAKKRHQASILDLVKGQLSEIRTHYGKEDRLLLDAHADNVRALEKRTDDLQNLSCSHPYTPHKRTSQAASRDTNLFTQMAGLQTDLLVMALGCGLTRVASLQYSTSVSDSRITGVNEQSTIHGTMHARPKEEKVRINQYFVKELASLLGKLDAQKRPDGTTLLDETLVVWGSEMAVGNHLNNPVPFILAGGGNALKQGYFANLEERPRHTRLLVTILKTLGIDDVEALGDLRGDNDMGPINILRG
jgi:Protein of unknown function (DUF1552)